MILVRFVFCFSTYTSKCLDAGTKCTRVWLAEEHSLGILLRRIIYSRPPASLLAGEVLV